MSSNRLFAFLVCSHKFHLQRKDTILWLFLLISLSNTCGTNCCSANGAAFLCVSGIKSFVKTEGAEEVT
jgi:hypothetical protein